MMGAVSQPWPTFAEAVRARFPEIDVHIAEPGFALEVGGGPSLVTRKAA